MRRMARTAAKTLPIGALKAFQTYYGDDSISKWDIFYYNYGILHHPGYRDKYREDLKCSLPWCSLRCR